MIIIMRPRWWKERKESEEWPQGEVLIEQENIAAVATRNLTHTDAYQMVVKCNLVG